MTSQIADKIAAIDNGAIKDEFRQSDMFNGYERAKYCDRSLRFFELPI